MPSLCVVGMQWGDEGKGKLIDYLAAQADVVVRYAGGSNAGHTVVVNGEKTVLHLLPSGILHEQCLCVVGNGVVVDPGELLEEIALVESRGATVGDNLLISDRAQVVMPYHKVLDKVLEEAKGAGKLGTTLRGIGPCYADKASRTGIRMIELVRPDAFKARLEATLPAVNRLLEQVYGHEALSLDDILAEYGGHGERLRRFVGDSVTALHRAFAAGKKVLFEGAQGSMLDIDFGTYPFLTSSNASVCGVPAGTGVPPRLVGSVLGVVKAYTTRVGAGPFPTELHGDLGDRLREDGGEFGATTGRPRRCGWLDAVALRYALAINGTDRLAITKLDVLDGQPTLKVCTAYRHGKRVYDTFPSDLAVLEGCEPQYEELAGWQRDTSKAQHIEDLPAVTLAYLNRIEELLGVPIGIVSVGNERRQTILVEGDGLFR
ncbi:MAG TPA: adenylosuccinate synthase [Planctomycetota bacterium]|nr:adenylosuccinate synthase [Planctomycetota bacterium]